MRRPLIGGKDFQTFIGQGKQAQGGIMEGLTKKKVVPCMFFLRKYEEECVRGKLVIKCERMLFMEKMCANKEHGRKLRVASSCSRVHGRSSTTKPLDSYLK
jgi:hypothetical protein